MTVLQNKINQTVLEICEYLGYRPEAKIGIILGSGLDEPFFHGLEVVDRVPWSQLSAFKFVNELQQIKGHDKSFTFTHLGNIPILSTARLHMYESHDQLKLVELMRIYLGVLFELGVTNLIVSNIGGGLTPVGFWQKVGSIFKYKPKVGDIGIVDGFMTFLGEGMPNMGPEFVTLDDVIVEENLQLVEKACCWGHLNTFRGGLVYVRGPNFPGSRYEKKFQFGSGGVISSMSMAPEAFVTAVFNANGSKIRFFPFTFICDVGLAKIEHKGNLNAVDIYKHKMSEALRELVNLCSI